jgi:hypothetical protein
MDSMAGAEFPMAVLKLTPHTDCIHEAAGVPHRSNDKDRLGDRNSIPLRNCPVFEAKGQINTEYILLKKLCK